ncbi:MAG: hypothetical protein R2817_13610 [Flavobacteriales bacterium]
MNRTLLVVLSTPFWGDLQAQNDLVGLMREPGPEGTEAHTNFDPVLLDSGLPVLELVSFEAESKDPATVEVRFATVSERPTEAFRLERSADLIHWDVVARVDGHGTSDAYTPYTLLDEAPIAGVSYYRLLSKEQQGWSELSDLFSIRHEVPADLSIQGDPRPGRFSVLAQGTLSEVVILNNRGQFMPMDLQLDGDRVIVNAELLENGTYYVQAMVDGTPVMRPIVIHNGNIVGG